MFKPWAIISITVAVVVAFVLWASMIRFEVRADRVDRDRRGHAGVLAGRAVRGDHHGAAAAGVRAGVVGPARRDRVAAAGRPSSASASSSGVAALFYTLLFGYAAFTLAIMAVVLAARRRADRWSIRCCGWPSIAVIAGAIALIGWVPYLLAAIGGSPADSGTAQHYLPADGAQLSFPMLQFTLLGALCMVGTLWLVVRARSSTRAGALAIAVLAVYAWSLLSMLTTLARHHAAVVPAAADPDGAAGRRGRVRLRRGRAGHRRARTAPRPARRVVARRGRARRDRRADVQPGHPRRAAPDIVVAYTDTDGNGQRADRRPPGAEQYYREIDAKIRQVTGRPRDRDRRADRRLQLPVLLPVLRDSRA